MKKILLFTLPLILVFACSQKEDTVFLFSYFKNNGEDGLHLAYSEDALSWKTLNNDSSFLLPAVGKEKLMRDPCVIKGGDGKFHMVWTCGWNERGIGYAHSTDLIHWSEQAYLPVMQQEPNARNCWAPELYYDRDEEIYLIYWATTIPGKFAETDSTGDDGYNHRMYYTTTKDFKQFSKTQVLYDHGFNVIDATIRKVENEYLMFLKNETKHPVVEKNIRIARSPELLQGYTQASEPITGSWVEGPTVAHTRMGWIVYFDQYTRHRMGAVLSTDLVTWTDISDQVAFPEGTRHGTVFKVKKDELDKLLSSE
ncbi:glycoside hydrolase family 43 protein [Rapidithrix thailandica]|uniref:Glycoside hydrolase family 43 protein n=1 Tax=Rapidithrix thailandica TaxID=413964 RepID=A0AAW9S1L1_9BACT